MEQAACQETRRQPVKMPQATGRGKRQQPVKNKHTKRKLAEPVRDNHEGHHRQRDHHGETREEQSRRWINHKVKSFVYI